MPTGDWMMGRHTVNKHVKYIWKKLSREGSLAPGVRVVKEGLTEKVTFEQRPGGS